MTAILMDGRYLQPRASGIGRYQRELVSEMQRLRPELDFRFIVRRAGDEEPLHSSYELEFDHDSAARAVRPRDPRHRQTPARPRSLRE